MRPAAILFALAALFGAVDFGLRVAGAAEHTSAVVGMNPSTIGALYMLVHLLAVVVAPIFVIAATFGALNALRHEVPRAFGADGHLRSSSGRAMPRTPL